MLEHNELRAFHAVAKHLNFSRAAQDIGLSAPQLTKIISHLEEKIKCKLLHRTTRSVRLTEDGRIFLTSAKKSLDVLNETTQLFDIKTKPEDLRGSLKITAPNTLGTRFLAEPLWQFTKKCPQVQTQVVLTDHYLNFMEDEIDVALRVMKPLDSGLIAKKISENNISFYASPSYLSSVAPIKSLKHLTKHPIFCISPHLSLHFAKAKISLEEVVKSPSILCTNGDLLVEMGRLGHGIVVRSDWGVQREVMAGQLIKIDLEDELVSETSIYVVYPKHRHTPLRVRFFIDILEASSKSQLK